MKTAKIRILIIDDDPGDFQMTRAMIESAERPGSEYEVEWAASGQEAAAAFRNDEHDVYLVDYFLEDRDGLDVVREARALGVRQPLIMLTGRGSYEVDLKAMEAGASDYLVKGQIDPTLLERTIRYSVERLRDAEELRRQREEAEQIAEIGRALSSSLDAKEVLGMVIQAVLTLVDADGSSVWLLEGVEAQVAASAGSVSVPGGHKWTLKGALLEQLLQERVPVFMDDLEESSLVPESLRVYLTAGSALIVPLVVGSQVAGALAAVSSSKRFFQEEQHYRVLSHLASQASVALENARLHERLQALSMTDSLTGLPNRRHLQMHMEREVAAAHRGRDLISVMFDLDHFKQYNDSRGHLAGDEALKAFARILADENRTMNLVARYGGDEFVSVLSDAKREGAEVYVERVKEKVASDPILAGGGVSASAGMAAFDRATMKTPEDLLELADTELRANKSRRPARR